MDMFKPKRFKKLKDAANPYCALYELEDGSRFYIEPGFHSQLEAINERSAQQLSYIIEEIARLVKKNKAIVFTLDYAKPLTRVEGFIFLELKDVTNPLNMFFLNSQGNNPMSD
jgi:hypothetical protein